MPQSRITINEVGTVSKVGKNSFQVPVKYMDKGKEFTKKVMQFANKEIYELIRNAKAGEQYDVQVDKDDNGYWQWSSLTKVDASTPAAAASNPAANARGGSYETADERRARQFYIARQSSLERAVSVYGASAVDNVDAVLELAATFENWVMRPTTEDNDGE